MNKFKQQFSLLTKLIVVYIILVSGYFTANNVLISDAQHVNSNLSSNNSPTILYNETKANQEKVSATPTRLIIPRLDIDIKIVEGSYKSADSTWTLSDDYVHHADITSKPNNTSGNTLIYGHNYDNVLGTTRDIKPNDIVLIETDKDKTFRYVYKEDIVVDPSDTEIFNINYAEPHLTILTCDGEWDQFRRIMTFKLQRVL